jgi:hypothetical protein
VVKDTRRDVGISRLRVMNPQRITSAESLNELELHSIAVHIYATVPHIDRIFGDYESAIPRLQKMIATADIAEMKISNMDLQANILEHAHAAASSSPSSSETPAPIGLAKVLYTRGVPSNLCMFLLTGLVTVYSGVDAFRVTVGPWSVLGQERLLHPAADNVPFVPDFTAVAASKSIKYLVLRPSKVLDSFEVSPSDSGSNSAPGTPTHSRGKSNHAEYMKFGDPNKRGYQLTHFVRRTSKPAVLKQSDPDSPSTTLVVPPRRSEVTAKADTGPAPAIDDASLSQL